MDVRTLQRGLAATRRRTRRTWALWLLASLALHTPFTPLAGLLDLFRWVKVSDDDGPPPPALTEIPVDIWDEMQGQASAPPLPEPAPVSEPQLGAAEPAEPAQVVKKRPPKPPVDAGAPDAALDAGVPDAALDAAVADAAVTDGGPSDAGAMDGGAAPSDAGLADAGSKDSDAGGSSLSEPVAALRSIERVAGAGANVQLVLDTEKLRAHPLGARIGRLLAGVYQWRDFLGPAALDPVRDIDRIVIVGPQLRRSADVVVMIQHRLGRERMHAALDRLVRREGGKGEWLEGNVPVAAATADGAPRYFVQPSPSLVVVTPESSLPSARHIGARSSVPHTPGNTVAWTRVVTPWRAVRGLPFKIPESIRWVQAQVEPGVDGGALISLRAEDESAEAAEANAVQLERALIAATTLNLGFLGDLLGQRPRRFVERIELRAVGSKIEGSITLTDAQIDSALELAEMWLAPPPPRSATQAPAAASGEPHKSPRRPRR